MSLRTWITSGAVIGLLAGCASPGDVEADYETAQDTFEAARDVRDADMATAVEWNTHTLGIPASGWLAIVIVGVVIGGVLVGLAGWAITRALDSRRRNRHALDLERERTARVAAERGPCTVCGAAATPTLNPKGT